MSVAQFSSKANLPETIDASSLLCGHEHDKPTWTFVDEAAGIPPALPPIVAGDPIELAIFDFQHRSTQRPGVSMVLAASATSGTTVATVTAKAE